MALNALAIRNAAPKERPYKLADGDGLHLLVNPNGSKLWRFRYQFGGKEKMVSLGGSADYGDYGDSAFNCASPSGRQASRRSDILLMKNATRPRTQLSALSP